MEPETPPRLGFFLRLCCFLTGVDPELLRRCPPRDRSSVVTITLLMLAIWLWQTLAFSLTAHMLLDEMHRVRPDLVAIAALLAGVVMLVDSFTIIRSSWFLSGIAQLQRGGLEIPGAAAARIKNGLQLVFRLPLAGVLAQLAAIGFMLYCFTAEISRGLEVNATAENAPIAEQVAKVYDAGSVRLETEIKDLRAASTTATTDASRYRLDALETAPEDPELKPAIEQVRRAESAKTDAERRLAQVPRRDEAARRIAGQRLGARKAELQTAQARVDKLRSDAASALVQRRAAVQGRLDETLAADQRRQARIDALEKEHAARLAAREDTIRQAMLRDPGYRPPDRGLLARVKVLAQLMQDPWVFTVATLLHIGFFGIELGAVLCKVLTSVPSFYAVTLAGEEYANEVETANGVFRRIAQQEPPEPEGEPDATPPPEPDAPAPGDAGTELPEPPANDDETPDADGNTAARLKEGARLLEAGLDRPARARNPHEIAERCPRGRMREIEGPLVRIGKRAAHEKRALEAGRRAAIGQAGPVVQARSLGALARAQALPDRRGVLGQRLDLIGIPVCHRAHGQALARGHGQHVADLVCLRPTADGVVGPIHAVARNPGKRQARRAGALQHGKAERRLGGKPHRVRHMGRPATGAIVRPGLGQVQRPVDQRVAVASGIAQKHPDLRVLDPPGRAGVLPLHARRLRSLLQETRLVQHQHRVRIAQVIGHISLQVVAHRIGIPAHPAQELLNPVRARIARRFRQLPAVLALHRRQKTAQIRRRPPTRLGPAEPSGKPFQNRLQTARPARCLSSRHCRHGSPPP